MNADLIGWGIPFVDHYAMDCAKLRKQLATNQYKTEAPLNSEHHALEVPEILDRIGTGKFDIFTRNLVTETLYEG